MIIGLCELQAVDQRADGGRLDRTEPSVLQVEVMNDCRDPGERRFVQHERIAEHFESAPLILMTQLHAEHVERYGIGWR